MKYLKNAVSVVILSLSLSIPLLDSANAIVATTCQLGGWAGYERTWATNTTWTQSDASAWDDITLITTFSRQYPINLKIHSNTSDISDTPFSKGHILLGISSGEEWKAHGQTMLLDNSPLEFGSGVPCGPTAWETVLE